MLREASDKRGMALRIERSSIHDGSGFRTVVFLKGCPLCCQWCSTPESQSFAVEEGKDYSYGKEMTVEEVMKEVRKDSAFYFHSGGGMTLSGGEPLSQPEFAIELLRQARGECVNTALETTFFAPPEVVEASLPHLNTLFVDLKFFDDDKHKRYTGVSNDRILSNLLRSNQWEKPLNLVIRIPVIPGVNDDAEELERMGAFCAGLRHLRYVQLLPYHRLGMDTYRKLGRQYPLARVEPPSPERMACCRETLSPYVDRVI